MKQIIILYHKDCPDGFGAAWVARKKFGDKAEYIAVNPEELPEKPLQDKEIYIVDNGYTLPVLQKLIKNNKKVVVLDHHISRKNDTEKFTQNVFDNNHSGAVIAWQYFFPNVSVPKLLKHVEDVDLWKFKIKNTKAVAAFMHTVDFNFKIWDKLVRDFEKPKVYRKFVEHGEILLRGENKMIAKLVAKADLVSFQGYKTLVVNSPLFASQIGHALSNKISPIGIIWNEHGGLKKFSIRSNGKVDVSKIAEKFGGGGHKSAAGFALPAGKKLPWKRIVISD